MKRGANGSGLARAAAWRRVALVALPALLALGTMVAVLAGRPAWAQTAKELNQAAHAHYQQGQYAQAIDLLERSVRMEPTADSYYGLGMSYLKTGALDAARKNFRSAVSLSPSYLSGLHTLAAAYMRGQGAPFDLDKAKDVLEDARAIDPDHRVTLSKLGEIYFIKSTIGVDTTHEAMARNGELAEKVLRRLLQLHPDDSQAHMLLGQIHGNRGQFNSAILEFQKAVKADATNYNAWLYLGMDYYRIGLLKEAAQAFRMAGHSGSDSVRETSAKYLQRIEQQQAQQP